MTSKKEYVWKEHVTCPYCSKRITEGKRMFNHVLKIHPEKWAEWWQMETHKFDSLFAILKKVSKQ